MTMMLQVTLMGCRCCIHYVKDEEYNTQLVLSGKHYRYAAQRPSVDHPNDARIEENRYDY